MTLNMEVVSKMSSLSVDTTQKAGNFFDSYAKSGKTSLENSMNKCFTFYDRDSDSVLNKEEFYDLLKDLFCRGGVSYDLSEKEKNDIFKLMDDNNDGVIDKPEFRVAWFHWLKQVLDPISAIIVVDVQNDFITGSLAVKDCPAGQDGEAVVPVINYMLETCKFDCVVYSYDWHPKDHISFVENVAMRPMHHSSKVKPDEACKMDTVVFNGPPIIEQKLWPTHCVQKTWGSELHPDLKVSKDSVHVYKGTNPDIDSYSAFWDNKKMSQTDLVNELTSRSVTDVYVVGLAYDVCVGSTALHALEHGFRTVVVDDACRGVTQADIESMKTRLKARGACIVQSSDVANMVNCTDRRPDLGLQAALNVAMARKLIKEAKNKSTNSKDDGL